MGPPCHHPLQVPTAKVGAGWGQPFHCGGKEARTAALLPQMAPTPGLVLPILGSCRTHSCKTPVFKPPRSYWGSRAGQITGPSCSPNSSCKG